MSLQDRLTGPMMKIMRAMESTIKVMEQMDSTTQQLDQKSLANARKNITNASADLERLQSSMQNTGRAIEQATRNQDRFNNSLGDGLSTIKSYATGILAAVGAYKAFNAAKNMISNMLSRGFEMIAFRQSTEAAFTIFLGSAEKAKKYMDDMYAFALKTPFAYPDLLESSRNMIAMGVAAQNTFPIMQSIGDAVAGLGKGKDEMMRLADIFGSIQLAGKATLGEIRRFQDVGVEAMGMLAKHFDVSIEEMEKRVTKGAVSAGEAIAAVVEGINEQFGGSMAGVKGTVLGALDSMRSAIRNAGEAMLENLTEPITKGIGTVTELIKKIPQHLGPAIAAFIPLIEMFNHAVESNKLDHILSVIGIGLTSVAWILSGVGQAALWVAGIFSDNWSWIAPILFIIGFALSAVALRMLVIRSYTLLATAAQWAYNTAMAANPATWIILAIVAAIALVIYATIAWSEKTAMVVGAIVGSFYWLGAAIMNIIIGISNFILLVLELIMNGWFGTIFLIQMLWFGLSVLVLSILDGIINGTMVAAEFLVNTWNRGTYAVQMAFYNMGQGTLNVMSGVVSGTESMVNRALESISNLINGAISGANKLIGWLNSAFGLNIDSVGEVDLSVNFSRATNAITAMQAKLSEPIQAAPVSFGRSNMSGSYAASNMPTMPEYKKLERLDYMNMGDAFNKGYDAGSDLSKGVTRSLKGISNALEGYDSGPKEVLELMDAAQNLDPTANELAGGDKGKNPTGGKLDKIGKIDDKINIADEDLKLLLEYADRKSIQDVSITLTPTVSFGDLTIREEADIDKIVDKINKNFEDEMERSVEGVVEA
ncbi:hypothetical protein BEP19_09790 [Ammoniphilus oxalaticus]|uniref:Tape measure protein N-terminal domain-containing protein n=1 Tax=Ammoniphilus oxalaticus TaxID=66863 RepID=A0A419SFH7_9BACL|nr:tape measure protein [Ammoniphilus oxalaticus]RKD22543.1 hypothetical protein BEP19_09790 [Ammoniphilus oxalaticus]